MHFEISPQNAFIYPELDQKLEEIKKLKEKLDGYLAHYD